MIAYSELINRLEPIVREAGAAIMDIHGRDVVRKTKPDNSPVTEADIASEKIILAVLREIAGDIPVISEENTLSHSLATPDCFFLVDPLDGTKEFLKEDSKGAFTVNIALIEHGAPTMGIVFAPALDRMFTGSPETVANENGMPISVRGLPDTGPVAVASASHRDEETNLWLSGNGIDQTVSIGSSLKFCLIAAGEADVYPRFSPTMEWDTAAGDAILRAAGGSVCNPDRSPFTYGKSAYRNGPFIACGRFVSPA